MTTVCWWVLQLDLLLDGSLAPGFFGMETQSKGLGVQHLVFLVL